MRKFICLFLALILVGGVSLWASGKGDAGGPVPGTGDFTIQSWYGS
jgi:hypothetical protein